MVDKITVTTVCDSCNKQLDLEVPISADVLDIKASDIGLDNLAPDLEAGWLKPKEEILVYKVNTKDIEKYLTIKSKIVDPNIKLIVDSTYISREKRFSGKANHAYSSLQLTFSTNAIKSNKYGEGWPYEYEYDNGRVILIDSLMDNIIRRYSYNRKELIELTKPKKFDKRYDLEQKLSIDDKYLKQLIHFSIPRVVENTTTGNKVVIVVLSPELVLKDMFREMGKNHKSSGLIDIKSVNFISEGIVEYLIHLYPGKSELRENPHVRQILLGERK